MIKKIDDCININSANPSYLRIFHATGDIEEKDANKYLIFESTDENNQLKITELLKNIMMFLMELEIKEKKHAVINVIIKKIT